MERYEKGRGGTQWYNIPLSVWATVMYKNIEDTLKTQKFLIKEIYIPVPIAVAEGKYIMTESGNSHHYLQKFLSSLLD